MNNLKNISKAISNHFDDPTTSATETTTMNNVIDSTATEVKPSKSKAKRVAAQKAPKAKPAKAEKKSPAQIVADRIAAMGNSEAPSTDDAFMLDVSTQQNLPAKVAPTVSPLAIAIRDARTLHRRMKTDFITGLSDIAQQVIAAKAAAKKEGVPFDSLFGNTEDETKFPFSQNWANTIVRVYESKLLDTRDVARLPSDLTTLATLASTKPANRDAAMKRYEEIRTGDYNIIEGEIVLAKVTTQKAMKKAKAEVEGEGEEKPVKIKEFNAARMARALLTDLGADHLSDLADAIDKILQEEGVR